MPEGPEGDAYCVVVLPQRPVFATVLSMKAILQAGSSAQVPTLPESGRPVMISHGTSLRA